MSDDFSGVFGDDEVISTKTAFPQFKVKIVGDKGVGKSSLLVSCSNSKWKEDAQSNRVFPDAETKTKSVEVNNNVYNLEISDAKPSDKTVRGGGLVDADGIVLVYDVTRLDTFDRVTSWARQIDRYASQRAVVVLVGNKADKSADKTVSTVDAKRLADAKGWIFYEISAKDTFNLDQCFQSLAMSMQSSRADADKPRKSKKSKCNLQ